MIEIIHTWIIIFSFIAVVYLLMETRKRETRIAEMRTLMFKRMDEYDEYMRDINTILQEALK